MSKEFYETRKIFRVHINFTHPYSWEEWNSLPEDQKAAALYVQFFDEILLAWYKSKSFYASEQEGVETVLQYLCKNVPLIESNSKKFNPRYIYRVAYNCLYCISHDRVCDKKRFELEISNIVQSSQDELDLFDFIEDPSSDEYDVCSKSIQNQFWKDIESDPDMDALVENILNGRRLPFRGRRKAEAFQKLQVKLEVYKKYYY